MQPLPYWKRAGLLAALLGLAVPAWGDGLTVDGRKVTAETGRYRATFDGVNLIGLENRLTGETYVVPDAPGADNPASSRLAERSGIAVESLRPAVPVRYYRICDRTQVISEKLADGIRVTFQGLEAGPAAVPAPEKDGRPGEVLPGMNAWPAEFAPAMKLVVTFAIEADTGDLVVTPEAQGHIEEVAGVRDRGVLRSGFQMQGLTGDARLIVPSDHGVAYTTADAPASWSDTPESFRWPQRWEAALLVAEGKKGGFAVWADEPRLRYGRVLTLCRAGAGWAAAVEFETTAMNYRCDDLTHAAWRLNVFEGNWVKAAARYQAQMQQQWPDLQPLARRAPAWADRVRLVVEPALPDEKTAAALAAFPRDRVAVFCREGWSLDGAAFREKPPTSADTRWPPARTWGFKTPTNFAARIAALESRGFHVFAYANPALIVGPWQMHPFGYEPPLRDQTGYLYSWRPWARFFPEACRDYVKQTGASGVGEGFSWVMRRSLGDEPPDENWFTGSLGMRRYLRELLPETALMGDQVNEVTCRGQHLSRAITADPRHAHPISAFLFGPFTRQWSASALPEINAADDIHGFLQGWPSDWSAVLPAQQTPLRRRGELFAQEDLQSVWPETWEPRVRHYYRGKDGTEFRLLADQGTRLVKVAGGKEETVYWRVSGVSEADLKGQAIPQWIGYDGDRAIGLNPAATYVTEAGGTRPPVLIAALPKDAVIARTLQGDGYWLADLYSERNAGRAVTVVVRGSDQPVSFAGADAVKELPDRRYEVTLKTPGALVAYWTPPGRGLTLSNDVYRLTLWRPPAGLGSSRGAVLRDRDALLPTAGSAEEGEESVIAWLVKMPLEQPWLVFAFGAGGKAFTQGVHYRVRVNGRTVWERLRVETELKASGTGTVLTEKPVRSGAVNLKAYEDKTVLIELAAAVKDASPGNVVRWDNPRLVDQPPTWDAEMDKAVEAPQVEEMPAIRLKD